MRILFIYPPPFKICTRSGEIAGGTTLKPGGDTLFLPYGLLSIAAQAKSLGHDVDVINMSNFYWKDIESLIDFTEAVVFGISCITANRHVTAEAARLIKARHPTAHVVIGGHHPSAQPNEMLRSCPEIDTVVVGEGEATFLELIIQMIKKHISPERVIEATQLARLEEWRKRGAPAGGISFTVPAFAPSRVRWHQPYMPVPITSCTTSGLPSSPVTTQMP